MQCETDDIVFESIEGVEISVAARDIYENHLMLIISKVQEDFKVVEVFPEKVSIDDDGDMCVYLPMKINDHLSIKLEVCRVGLGHWRWMEETIH